LLAGVMLTDQALPWSGNLWVWPGSHQVVADHLRQAGPEAIMGHPTLAMACPEQVLGYAGDVLLSHYLLGHNMGGNRSDDVRKTVYFRLRAVGHRDRWRDFVRNRWLELKPVTRLADEA
jgi:ectoine hydroxylase-related dioxygenase (phytanoyl-CoA dioxygenase family)